MKVKPIDKKRKKLLDKVREHIIHLRDYGAEEAKKNKYYFSGIIWKEDFAELFKVAEGDIQYCFQLLNLEGLLSQAVKYMGDDKWSPDRYYIQNWKKAPKEELPEFQRDLFGYTNCPICESELENISSYNDHHQECSNGCFKYEINYHKESQEITMFDRVIFVHPTLGKGQVDRAKHEANKLIKKWKQNNQYIAEILTRDY